ncbi:unnamed protein product [Polarella glacialis]|uniref:JmjC domain-containing protein n=1 Tax=Polarella glacialis TaxID=89957 RepID=A0A813E3J2_POLGL|nr:unnamed protein product [Polarella glacialis]
MNAVAEDVQADTCRLRRPAMMAVGVIPLSAPAASCGRIAAATRPALPPCAWLHIAGFLASAGRPETTTTTTTTLTTTTTTAGESALVARSRPGTALNSLAALASALSELAASARPLALLLGDEAAWRVAVLGELGKPVGICRGNNNSNSNNHNNINNNNNNNSNVCAGTAEKVPAERALQFASSWRSTALGQRRPFGAELACLRDAAAEAWLSCCTGVDGRPESFASSSCSRGLKREAWPAGSSHPLRRVDSPLWLDAREQLPGCFSGWPNTCWTAKTLRRRFGRRKFTVVQPGAGKTYQMRLEDFFRYAATNRDFLPPRWDAEPLYLFEPKPPLSLRVSLREPRLCAAPNIARSCPALGDVLGEATRGWLLIGGVGSGSRFHIDAYGCGAWSVCLEGRKRWAMYPPEAGPPPGVALPEPGRYASPAPIFWFSEVLPCLPPALRPAVDIVVEAGDILYVPPGWWHCVLNLSTPCVAFTRNVAYGLGSAQGVADALAAANKVEAARALREFAWRCHRDDDSCDSS